MTDNSDESNFFVPSFIRSKFEGLLLPGQKLEEIFDQIGGLVSEGLDEIGPDETVWGSKTMTLHKKKPQTLDMFFNKVVKKEISDGDSNCSVNSNDDSVEESNKLTKFKNSPDSAQKISEKGSKDVLTREKNIAVTPTSKVKTKINKSKQHSVSSDDESLEKHASSSIHSLDLFAEEPQKSSDHHDKTNSVNSLSEEEIIPSSQDQQSFSRISLGNLSADRSSIKSSQISKVSKQSSSKKTVTQNTSIDKEISSSSSSSSSEEEDNEQPALSKLDSIKNKMKNIKEVFSGIENHTEKFSFEDLTEDDEIYILQCPNEVDCKKLKGVELTLEGNSVVSVDEESNYDCFSMKENTKRFLYVALPDSKEQGMKLGVFRLAGNIILSENLGIPYTKPIEDDTLGNVTSELYNNSLIKESTAQHVREKKKKHRKTDGCDIDSKFSEFEDSQIIPNTQDQGTPLKIKKKKRSMEDTNLNSSSSDLSRVRIPETDCEDSQIIPDTQDQGTPLKIKKKKRSMEDTNLNSSSSDLSRVQIPKTDWKDSQIIPDSQDQGTPLKIKKKKRSMEDTNLNSSSSDLSRVQIPKTDWEDSQIIPDTQDQEASFKVKKNRRSKEDITQDKTTDGEFFSENVTDVLNNLASKKKKRKHFSLESSEITDCESDFDKFLNIKTELGEPQVVSDFQDTPSKSKKRSRKDIEDSEEFSNEEIPRKKKKKKHSYSESQDTL